MRIHILKRARFSGTVVIGPCKYWSGWENELELRCKCHRKKGYEEEVDGKLVISSYLGQNRPMVW